MIKVYYKIEDGEDGLMVFTTEKTFWDKHHELDDGSSGHVYIDISSAMNSIGCLEEMESMFDMAMPEEKLIIEMAKHGFEMIKNDKLV